MRISCWCSDVCSSVLRSGANGMAIFTCHFVGGTKQVRVERTVRLHPISLGVRAVLVALPLATQGSAAARELSSQKSPAGKCIDPNMTRGGVVPSFVGERSCLLCGVLQDRTQLATSRRTLRDRTDRAL